MHESNCGLETVHRTLESKVITLANHNCRRYSNESNRTQRKQRQPALSAKKKKKKTREPVTAGSAFSPALIERKCGAHFYVNA